jgi:hypothetical protein
MNYHQDKQGCKAGAPFETHHQTWFVDPKHHGVRYVVVWLDPPPGKYYTLREQDKKRQGEEVVIDQPHCAFIPHVANLFPAYYDGAKEVPTGQKLVIKNSAPFLHSIGWPRYHNNDMVQLNVPPNGGRLEFVLNPEKAALPIGCGIHNWMKGVLWIFEHPYHAVTNEDGTFEISNVPTGVELTFNAWHEDGNKYFDKRKVTLKQGENPPIELKIKK